MVSARLVVAAAATAAAEVATAAAATAVAGLAEEVLVVVAASSLHLVQVAALGEAEEAEEVDWGRKAQPGPPQA